MATLRSDSMRVVIVRVDVPEVSFYCSDHGYLYEEDVCYDSYLGGSCPICQEPVDAVVTPFATVETLYIDDDPDSRVG